MPWQMPSPTSASQAQALRLLAQPKINICSLFGCSARLTRILQVARARSSLVHVDVSRLRGTRTSHGAPTHPRGQRRKQHLIAGIERGQTRNDEVGLSGRCSSLADAASSPRDAAAAASAASAASATSAAASAASATSAAASAASATPGQLFAQPRCLLVEDVERPQADVGDFLLIEGDFGSPYGAL